MTVRPSPPKAARDFAGERFAPQLWPGVDESLHARALAGAEWLLRAAAVLLGLPRAHGALPTTWKFSVFFLSPENLSRWA